MALSIWRCGGCGFGGLAVAVGLGLVCCSFLLLFLSGRCVSWDCAFCSVGSFNFPNHILIIKGVFAENTIRNSTYHFFLCGSWLSYSVIAILPSMQWRLVEKEFQNSAFRFNEVYLPKHDLDCNMSPSHSVDHNVPARELRSLDH